MIENQTAITINDVKNHRWAAVTELASKDAYSPTRTLTAFDNTGLSRGHDAWVTPLPSERDYSLPNDIGAYNEPRSDIDYICDKRLELLVRKTEREPSIEDDARFYLLTCKLRRLAPRVPKDAWDNLMTVTSMLEEVSNNLGSIK
jgi:hypothetical protein